MQIEQDKHHEERDEKEIIENITITVCVILVSVNRLLANRSC